MIFILTSPKNTQLNSHFYSLILKNIEKVTLIVINQFYLHLFNIYIYIYIYIFSQVRQLFFKMTFYLSGQ